MDSKRDLLVILLLALVLVGIQLAFKTRLNEAEIAQFKRSFSQAHRNWIGQYAPNFTLTELDGTRFELADILGKKVVVLNFFTTWCGPCRQEMPELAAFLEKQKGKPVVFLAIGVKESDAQLTAYRRELKLAFPMAADADETVAAQYHISAYPTTVVIGADGLIMQYEAGAIRNADITLSPMVKMLVGQIPAVRFDRAAYLKEAPPQLPAPPDQKAARKPPRQPAAQATPVKPAAPPPSAPAGSEVGP